MSRCVATWPIPLLGSDPKKHRFSQTKNIILKAINEIITKYYISLNFSTFAVLFKMDGLERQNPKYAGPGIV
jgi:hypothetical protein